MTKQIKFSTALGLTLVALVAAVMIVLSFAQPKVHAGGINISSCDNVAGMGGGGSRATSTPVYLGTATATSTLGPCTMTLATRFTLNVRDNASTTASALIWVVQGSMDGIDWYNLDTNAVKVANVTPHNGTTTDTFIPGVVGVSTMNYIYSPFGVNYVRVQYSQAVGNSAVYMLLTPFNDIIN